MEISETLKIQINQYINDELKGEDLLDFEATLTNNQPLQERVNFYKTLDDTLSATLSYQKEDEQLASLLNSLGDEFIVDNTLEGEQSNKAKIIESTANPSNRKPLISWLIPAATLAAAALVLLMFFPLGEKSPVALANKYYSVYDASFTVKGEATELSKASNYYSNQNWADALAIFSNYPQNNKAQLAKGNCEYQLKKFSAALGSFRKVADGNSDYAESAAWYTALCFLQMDRKADAVGYLEKVSDQSKYYQQAKVLLGKL